MVIAFITVFSNTVSKSINIYTEKNQVRRRGRHFKSALGTIRGMLPKKLQYNIEMYIIQIVSKSKIKKESKISEI